MWIGSLTLSEVSRWAWSPTALETRRTGAGLVDLYLRFEGSEPILSLVRTRRLIQQLSILFEHSSEGVEDEPLRFEFFLELREHGTSVS